MNQSAAAAARRARIEASEDRKVNEFLDAIGLSEANCIMAVRKENFSNADRVGPDARKKLKGILDKYRKSAHPFTDCVRDNTKRFGKEGAEKVCAVLKDIIKGTTKWRKGGKANHSIGACPVVDIDNDVYALLMAVDETKLKKLLSEEAS